MVGYPNNDLKCCLEKAKAGARRISANMLDFRNFGHWIRLSGVTYLCKAIKSINNLMTWKRKLLLVHFNPSNVVKALRH